MKSRKGKKIKTTQDVKQALVPSRIIMHPTEGGLFYLDEPLFNSLNTGLYIYRKPENGGKR